MTIIEHDFGLKERLTERRFAQLLALDALHEANLRNNPLPYIERASERIFRLQQVLLEAIHGAKGSLEAGDGSTASAEGRLAACLDLLEKGHAAYGGEDALG